MKALVYHGRPMAWTPSRVRCIHGGTVLAADEPEGGPLSRLRQIVGLLRDGYGCVVELQPGDGTRYSLVLLPLHDGFLAGLTGTRRIGSPRAWFGKPFVFEDENPWTAAFISWWASALTEREAGR